MSGFRVIQIAGPVSLQVEIEGVKEGRNVVVRTETFVKVRLSVAIEIVQADKAILAGDVDLAVDHFKPKGFVHAGGKTFPFDFMESPVDSGDNPNVSTVRANGHSSIRKEGQSRSSKPGLSGRNLG